MGHRGAKRISDSGDSAMDGGGQVTGNDPGSVAVILVLILVAYDSRRGPYSEYFQDLQMTSCIFSPQVISFVHTRILAMTTETRACAGNCSIVVDALTAYGELARSAHPS